MKSSAMLTALNAVGVLCQLFGGLAAVVDLDTSLNNGNFVIPKHLKDRFPPYPPRFVSITYKF